MDKNTLKKTTILGGLTLSGLLIASVFLAVEQDHTLPIQQISSAPSMANTSDPKPTAQRASGVSTDQPDDTIQEDDDMSFSPGDRPHPITEDHEQIFAENALAGEVLGAIDVADANALRTISLKYKNNYPDQVVMYRGIDVIATCLENKNASAIYDARTYYETERASRLRRYVRRYCLSS